MVHECVFKAIGKVELFAEPENALGLRVLAVALLADVREDTRMTNVEVVESGDFGFWSGCLSSCSRHCDQDSIA